MQTGDIVLTEIDVQKAIEWENMELKELEKEISELYELQVEFSRLISEQGIKIDLIEDSAATAWKNVQIGTKTLSKIGKRGYKYLLIGSSVGALVSSPVGIILAAKFGLISGIGIMMGGSLLGGYFGGKYKI